jgi:S-adenosylmethionine:tRNA ribosyltransferase-isomerase
MELYTRDFSYDLPDDRIALFPAATRDQSKLLFYNRGSISHHVFRDITDLIPEKALLVFNDSKVIPARLRFRNDTGAVIEVFLLNPADKNMGAHDLMSRTSPVQWICTIGNKKKWKSGMELIQTIQGITLTARLQDEFSNVVEFTFSEGKTWAEVLHTFGDTPLPPYIKRATDQSDIARYQTVYSHTPGAVAAPTAGLHFTPEIIEKAEKKGIFTDFLTLHVGAGTFMPIKAEVATAHTMHEESIYITEANIRNMIAHGDNIVAVGTTSCRSLESLYWYGVKLMEEGKNASFNIDQHFAYQPHHATPTRRESLAKILEVLQAKNQKALSGQTSIYIYPGYSFRMIDGLVTNFHQPNSTLLLLIAALIMDDWKAVYDAAMKSHYRFLSYGDSSLLLPRLN